LGKANVVSGAPTVTILVISLSFAQGNVEADWAEAGAEVIMRRCPICEQDSIVGHGRRRKQAHDAHHDWIGIRRGLCSLCGKTFTFLPPFSPAYSHYSLVARSHALRRYFVSFR
jgi:transposase-like protein